jgi:site-specific recombinase XerD
VTYSDQQRAVVEALGLSADDLRVLAAALERDHVPVTVREVAGAYLAGLPRHHRYAKSLERIIAWAGEDDASKLRPADVSAWAARAAEEARSDPKAKHGVGAQEAMVLAARAAFAAGAESGLVRANPASSVALPERPPSLRCALTHEQLAGLQIAVVARSRDPELDDLVFQLLRETACRRSGAIRLAGGDVAPATRMVRLVEKYGKERWSPLSAHLVARLQSHARARHDGCPTVLHRADGGHLTRGWFEAFAGRIQSLPWAAELGVSAHWLRHTTLTDVERVAGLRVAAAYAGHSDAALGVTGLYTKPSPAELRAAHAAVFFESPGDADDPATPPRLLHRAG